MNCVINRCQGQVAGDVDDGRRDAGTLPSLGSQFFDSMFAFLFFRETRGRDNTSNEPGSIFRQKRSFLYQATKDMHKNKVKLIVVEPRKHIDGVVCRFSNINLYVLRVLSLPLKSTKPEFSQFHFENFATSILTQVAIKSIGSENQLGGDGGIHSTSKFHSLLPKLCYNGVFVTNIAEPFSA